VCAEAKRKDLAFFFVFYFFFSSIPRVLGHYHEVQIISYLGRPIAAVMPVPVPPDFLLVLVNWVNCYHQKSTGPVLVLVTRPEIPVVQIRGIETDGVVQIDAPPSSLTLGCIDDGSRRGTETVATIVPYSPR